MLRIDSNVHWFQEENNTKNDTLFSQEYDFSLFTEFNPEGSSWLSCRISYSRTALKLSMHSAQRYFVVLLYHASPPRPL